MLENFLNHIYFNTYFNFIIKKKIFCFCDAPQAFQIGFQDPATETVEWLLNLHDVIMVDLWVIIGIIIYILFNILSKQTKNLKSNMLFSHCEYLEIFWTITPALILLGIALPTFHLLYALDDRVAEAPVLLKIIGHQWYWTYEVTYNNLDDLSLVLEYDSYIIATDQLQIGQIRLLEVDNEILLPIMQHIHLSVTSTDVLHSWAIPSFGIKIDACPGRITKGSLFIKRPGTFFGQCSEICGVNHGFMPIVVQAIDFDL